MSCRLILAETLFDRGLKQRVANFKSVPVDDLRIRVFSVPPVSGMPTTQAIWVRVPLKSEVS